MIARDRVILECYARRISPDDVTVRVMPFPHGTHGFVLVDPDGHYNIYLNSRDPYDVQVAALMHELDHIVRGDVFSSSPIEELEIL